MKPWEHDHTFGHDKKKPDEVRPLTVVLVTATTMVLEIVSGIVYGLADGLHVASHATALGSTWTVRNGGGNPGNSRRRN